MMLWTVTQKTVKQGGMQHLLWSKWDNKYHHYIYIKTSFKELGLQSKNSERKIKQICYLS